jgi:Asp/Glu/hydantoin racemase
MSKRLVLLHTVVSLVNTFDRLAAELLPSDAEVVHVADELLIKTVLADRGLEPFTYRRVTSHVVAAAEAGADVVMLTCSSISPCADAATLMVSIPVLKIDEPMVDKAISLGMRIGVAATAPTTLKPTTDLVLARAEALGRSVSVDSVLCEGAFEALAEGNPETHDGIVRAGLEGLVSRNDVVILAQASMARVVDTIPVSDKDAPILSSPRLAMERARDVLAQE